MFGFHCSLCRCLLLKLDVGRPVTPLPNITVLFGYGSDFPTDRRIDGTSLSCLTLLIVVVCRECYFAEFFKLLDEFLKLRLELVSNEMLI